MLVSGLYWQGGQVCFLCTTFCYAEVAGLHDVPLSAMDWQAPRAIWWCPGLLFRAKRTCLHAVCDWMGWNPYVYGVQCV